MQAGGERGAVTRVAQIEFGRRLINDDRLSCRYHPGDGVVLESESVHTGIRRYAHPSEHHELRAAWVPEDHSHGIEVHRRPDSLPEGRHDFADVERGPEHFRDPREHVGAVPPSSLAVESDDHLDVGPHQATEPAHPLDMNRAEGADLPTRRADVADDATAGDERHHDRRSQSPQRVTVGMKARVGGHVGHVDDVPSEQRTEQCVGRHKARDALEVGRVAVCRGHNVGPPCSANTENVRRSSAR